MATEVIPVSRIQQKIFLIRGQKVMLDMDLADLYGVSTKRLNEQVKRNRRRFPKDFMFRLTVGEKAEVVAICDHPVKLKFSPNEPFAFTEHGAIMAANILNSKRAIEMGLLVVRAILEVIKQLMAQPELEPEKPKTPIGFHP